MKFIRNIIIAVSLCLIIIMAGFFAVQQYVAPKTASEATQENQVKNYNTNELYAKIVGICTDKSVQCFQDNIRETTKTHGPQASLEVLRMLQDNGLVDRAVDDHELAHLVGKDTAAAFGINGEAFLSCPTSFNYGCQHGFFQYALAKVKPARKAVDAICGSLGSEYSAKFKFYCYHGVGHGVMDAESYNLKASLDVCDTLGNVGADGCWQGVFMENVNSGMRGEAPQGNFSATDPLAPCNQVNEKYHHECYVNHAGWLMQFFKSDAQKAINACLKAEKHINVCLQSLGLMATNPVWQPVLLGGSSNKNVEVLAQEICKMFPIEYQEQCIVAGVDNILNFDEFKTSRAQHFCDISPTNLQDSCYLRIGMSLRSQTTDTNLVIQSCSQFQENFKQKCLEGAGLGFK